MLRKLAKMFGGGMIGLMFAGVVIAFLLILVIAAITAVVIFPLFFLGLLVGSVFSTEFYKYLYDRVRKKRDISVSNDTKNLFKYHFIDLLESFGHRGDEVAQLKAECAKKEKEALEDVMRVERGIQSLKDTWQSINDKYVIKEGFLKEDKIISDRIKRAVAVTFKDPSFAKLSDEIENESVRFEEYLA